MSLEEDFRNFFERRYLASYPKCIRNLSVQCLQSLEDLKKTCDKHDLKFSGYSKEELKVDLILDDEVKQNQKLYLVKWRGWSNKHNSWQPACRLSNFECLLAYYTYLKYPTAILSEETVSHFIRDIMTRQPNDILSIKKLYAFIFRKDIDYINRLDLTFADLKGKITKYFSNPENKCDLLYHSELFNLMKFSEQRKIILSKLEDWEMEINVNSSVYIKVENNVDLAGPPTNFQFIDNYISSYIDLTENPVVFCSCVGCYKNSKDCCPQNSDGSFAYNKERLLQLPLGNPIYECNRLCNCDSNCTNRVVQHGPKVKVAIFRTKNGCDWGVKTLETVKKGQFVMEYLGEVITSEHAEEREDVYMHFGRTYLFDMGWKEDRFYVTDATLFGNASHFINHSCDPNLVTYSVWINQQNPALPRIALFAKRVINPGEELTFDYKLSYTRRRGVRVSKDLLVSCKCNSTNCRKYL